MAHEISIPMTEEMNVNLVDAFPEDKSPTLPNHVFSEMRKLCKEADEVLMKNILVVNVIDVENGQMKQEKLNLGDFDFDSFEAKEKPGWLPKELPKKENVPYVHKIGTSTLNSLRNYAKVVLCRYHHYNKSKDEQEEYLLDQKRADKNTTDEMVEKLEKQYDEAKKKRKKEVPTCFEEIIYKALQPKLSEKILAHIEKVYQKEQEELYPKKDKKKKEKEAVPEPSRKKGFRNKKRR